MNRLNATERASVIRCLIDGCSIRATTRISGISKKAVMRLLCEVGTVCEQYQNDMFQDLACRKIQMDEVWTWIYCKEKNRTEEIARTNPDAGDIWLWVAICADSKLVLSWMLGGRDMQTACAFVDDVAARLRHRVQITSDGHVAYLKAIEDAFGQDVDYAVLQKIFGTPSQSEVRRYSPAKCIGCESKPMIGNPDYKHVSTSYVERQNWTVRTNLRRYTRLSNGFSRKLDNHAAAVALNYFAYNFIKIHRTLRMSPAMAAGVTDRLWDVQDLVSLWEATERKEKAAA